MKNIVPPSPIRTLSIFLTDICFWEALHKTDLLIIGWHQLTTQGQGLGVPNPNCWLWESCRSWWMTDLENELQEEKSTRANGMFQFFRFGSRLQVKRGHLHWKGSWDWSYVGDSTFPPSTHWASNTTKLFKIPQQHEDAALSMRHHRSGFLQQDLKKYIRTSLAFRTHMSWVHLSLQIGPRYHQWITTFDKSIPSSLSIKIQLISQHPTGPTGIFIIFYPPYHVQPRPTGQPQRSPTGPRCSFPEPSASNIRKADSETELGSSWGPSYVTAGENGGNC